MTNKREWATASQSREETLAILRRDLDEAEKWQQTADCSRMPAGAYIALVRGISEMKQALAALSSSAPPESPT